MGAIAVTQRLQAGARRTVQRSAAKAGRNRERNDDHEAAEHREHTAPPEEIADQTGGRGAEQIAGHRACERSPDRKLPLVGTDEIAGQRQRHGKHAARADAGEDAGHEQHRKRGRECAKDVGDAEQAKADRHQPRLAEQIGGGADRRLDRGKGEGEHCGEARRGRDADAQNPPRHAAAPDRVRAPTGSPRRSPA
ncbi:hypothetical protein ACVWW1_002011 [Bradyrhizobium sp. JR3.5]